MSDSITSAVLEKLMQFCFGMKSLLWFPRFCFLRFCPLEEISQEKNGETLLEAFLGRNIGKRVGEAKVTILELETRMFIYHN